jgi:hypothetical protein
MRRGFSNVGEVELGTWMKMGDRGMSRKRDKTSTALAPQESCSTSTTGPDKHGGELPEKLTAVDDGLSKFQQTFATTDKDLAVVLALQTAATLGDHRAGPMIHKSTRAAVHSLGARDGTEALLAVQMVGVHNLAMKFLANAAMKDQTDHGVDVCVSYANRLLRTFTTQVEALKKYRSKGEQHCTVEHVHVHSGGQAVVGTVTARGHDRGEGDEGNGDQ